LKQKEPITWHRFKLTPFFLWEIASMHAGAERDQKQSQPPGQLIHMDKTLQESHLARFQTAWKYNLFSSAWRTLSISAQSQTPKRSEGEAFRHRRMSQNLQTPPQVLAEAQKASSEGEIARC
jgi:hypothetical protein